jgi:hypothetical protein
LNIFGYLADETSSENEAVELGKIVGYERQAKIVYDPKEQKNPDQIFLGIEPGSLISLADKKVFRPTNPIHQDFYKTSEPLADHLR